MATLHSAAWSAEEQMPAGWEKRAAVLFSEGALLGASLGEAYPTRRRALSTRRDTFLPHCPCPATLAPSLKGSSCPEGRKTRVARRMHSEPAGRPAGTSGDEGIASVP